MPKIAEFYAELGLKKDKFDRGLNSAGDSVKKLGSGFASALGIGALGFAAVGAAAVAMSVKAMHAWDQQAKAEAGLLNALKDRRDIQQYLIKQAGDLQRISLFGDEATIEAQKMLAIMGLSAAQIKDLIPLVQDFSQATGMGLAQAASLVGKTVGTSTNALARYGIEVDATASKSEKATAVMAKFTEMYGGQAKKAADVGISGLQQLQGAWGDILELFGAKIGPFMSAIAKLMTNKMLDAAGGAAATGLQKTVNQYLDADKDGRDRLIKQLEGSLTEYRAKWLEAKNNENAEARAHYATQIDLTQEALDKISELNKEGAATITLTEDEKRKAWEATNAKIREQIELLELTDELIRGAFPTADVSGAHKSLMATMFGTPEQMEAAKAAFDGFKGTLDTMLDPEESEEDPAWLTKLGEDLITAKDMSAQFVSDMNGMMEMFVEDFVGTFAEGIGRLMTGEIGMDQFFKSMLGMFGEFIVQMGKMVIAYGISMSAVKKAFTNPIAAVAAGIALVAIGSAISSLAAKGPGGGTSGSTTGMSGYGGSSQFSNTPGISGQQMLYTEISGDNLRIILDRSNRTTTRRY